MASVDNGIVDDLEVECLALVICALEAAVFSGDEHVVVVPAVDQFTAKEKGVLANSLYVAMTRAQSILTLFAQKMNNSDAQLLYKVLEQCLANLEGYPDVESEISPQDDLVEILDRIGYEHRNWLIDLWNRHMLSQEPLISESGEIIAEPLFSLRVGKKNYACFGKESPRPRILQRLEDFGVEFLTAGQTIAHADKESGKILTLGTVRKRAEASGSERKRAEQEVNSCSNSLRKSVA